MATLRSQNWFNDPSDPDMTALYLERYLNYGLTPQELQSGRPIIGIAQTGSDLAPCNRHHIELAERTRAGIRDAGGIPLEFPCHPIQETGKRPTAALDRNLAYLSLVEVLYGYPLDGVVLTTGCDKTTPALLMGAATVNIPAIVLSGGPMLDGHYKGKLAGSGTIIWEARRRMAAGEIGYEEFMALAAASAPSVGHCNTMGTALSMNSLAEALGMSLPGCASIPAPYRERGQMAYVTGKRIVEMVHEDLTPRKVMTKEAFENAIMVASALGASTNCPPHLVAIAKHVGVELSLDDWQRVGHELPLLVNCQPAGAYLGESFHRAGGVPAVMRELLDAGVLHGGPVGVSGRPIAESLAGVTVEDRDVIRPFSAPLMPEAGMLVLRGNLFDTGVMKTSVISREFHDRYLSNPGDPDAFEGRAIVFEGPEDYHKRINDPALEIDEYCILFIRGCGPVGYPGSAEVVNMQPPDALIRRGVNALPCIGDGRQSGTSASPSILNVSPEAAVGGGLALLKTGDRVRFDLRARRVDLLLPPEEIAARRDALQPYVPNNQTPWQQLYRERVGQLSDGACLDFATAYQDVVHTKGMPRHSH
ncbi:Galactonate dehydratase [Roseomonas mucosa]|uniref:IlvD/Edd family dehydratase n=1 Tax=Roseomonas TaxID=125216 RepID=UPI00095F3A9C|nr:MULTISPECIES: IlvD/Edd family dehydratase [Roseomonas]MDT8267299.1 IlvD/Edd family dehydratase [Roseomonas sp. DSM 102946]ATR21486.1 dihydroxy-acid dehydratase [Roseomonas sp. FDAARGOS_362]USQ70452.1 dihydroxy-acid dehydratase family protein [Roseomonas mucosa]UZO96142.1 Galactonate dehydratase [Roseomonas mucosa]GAV35612.1 L-arabonate dehydratase [Roseomonas sp. TAS13]